MHTHKVRSLIDYLNLINDLCKNDDFLFRGQRQDLPLLPKLGRLKYNVLIVEAEKEMLSELRRQSQPYLEFRPESDWDWLALAQHHGMATRLLDWSKNTLAALWFAVSQTSSGQDGIVWVLNSEGLEHVDASSAINPFDNANLCVFRPRSITRRIGAQQGWFTCHPYDAQKDAFIPLEKNKEVNARLHKIRVEHMKFWDIRWDLSRCGIHAASIFPDLDGLCHHLEWCFSLFPDEQSSKLPRSS